MKVPDEIRGQLEALARSRRTRTREFSPDRPCDWRALGMKHPKGNGETFTEDGCWEYIADMIGSGAPIEEIVLKKPAGKKGYVMLLPSGDDSNLIYVKLQLGSGIVIGRSFHYSETPLGEN